METEINSIHVSRGLCGWGSNAKRGLVAFVVLLGVANIAHATPLNIQTVALTTDRVGWGASVNDSGQVVFSQESLSSDSIMLSNPPPLPGGLFQYASLNSFVYTPAINNAGDIEYEVNGGIWINNQEVVKVGDAVPATSQTFSNISGVYNRDFSDAGVVTFQGQTSLGGSGLWQVDAAGNVSQVITVGESAAGGGGASFAQIGGYAMNSNGDLVFTATLNDGAATQGIWRQTAGGVIERVAIDSVTIISPTTGLPMQVPVSSIASFGNLGVDGNGNPIFQASIIPDGSSTPVDGVWRLNGSDAVFIPGASGWNLDVNAAGQMAFMSGNLFTTQDQSVWMSDQFGQFNLVAMQGQLLEVMQGDFRKIAEVDFAPIGLSDNGQLAFSAFFDDGSAGIFLAAFDYSQQPVPSPGTLPLLLIGVLVAPFAKSVSRSGRG